MKNNGMIFDAIIGCSAVFRGNFCGFVKKCYFCSVKLYKV